MSMCAGGYGGHCTHFTSLNSKLAVSTVERAQLYKIETRISVRVAADVIA